ncbi:hypothetical protein [Microvirga pudoricolor]|uniref:hypothetical protein n=1 Tax=Microvirga pudoricolor TaxID=2778729 RepID=UPI00194FC8DA|nr:hypothetical protein [Microvirga pudoricolor]MBM6592389.1 hypothetical protein [Microvirga pudoricolor]
MQMGIGIGLLVVGLGLLIIALPKNGEDYRPFMGGTLMRQLYPALLLTFFAAGAALTLSNL